MAAVLTNGKGFYDPLVYVLECHRLGIRLLPPWINAPGPGFEVVREGNPRTIGETNVRRFKHPLPTPEQQMDAENLSLATSAAKGNVCIRAPITRIKGLTQDTRQRIFTERQRGPFASLRDFYARVVPLPEEMDLLVRAGAFDGFGRTRTAQFWETQMLR